MSKTELINFLTKFVFLLLFSTLINGATITQIILNFFLSLPAVLSINLENPIKSTSLLCLGSISCTSIVTLLSSGHRGFCLDYFNTHKQSTRTHTTQRWRAQFGISDLFLISDHLNSTPEYLLVGLYWTNHLIFLLTVMSSINQR